MEISTISSGRLSPVEGQALPCQLPSLSRRTRMDVLVGMLASLDDATVAGRDYLMAKVLRLLRLEALDPEARFQPTERQYVVRWLDELEHEAFRPAPDPHLFDCKARMLMDVLALA